MKGNDCVVALRPRDCSRASEIVRPGPTVTIESALGTATHTGTLLAVTMVMAHVFLSHLDWSGAASGGTHDLATLNRDLDVTIDGFTVPVSAAPDFGGSSVRVNPEQMYVASLSSCYALTFLFLAARAHLGVIGYSDDAIGELAPADGKLRMASVILRPRITLESGADVEQARTLVDKAHRQCFIGNSVSANVRVEPVITYAHETASVQ